MAKERNELTGMTDLTGEDARKVRGMLHGVPFTGTMVAMRGIENNEFDVSVDFDAPISVFGLERSSGMFSYLRKVRNVMARDDSYWLEVAA